MSNVPDYCVELSHEQFNKTKKGIPVKLSVEQKNKMNKISDELEQVNKHYAEWFEENNRRFLNGEGYISLEDFYKQNNYFKENE